MNESNDLPDHETLLNFIIKRTLTLNAAKLKTSKAKHFEDSPRIARSHHAKRNVETAQWMLCKRRHKVMICENFRSKSATECKTIVETYRLCFNCLSIASNREVPVRENMYVCKDTRCCTTRTFRRNPPRLAHYPLCALTKTRSSSQARWSPIAIGTSIPLKP